MTLIRGLLFTLALVCSACATGGEGWKRYLATNSASHVGCPENEIQVVGEPDGDLTDGMTRWRVTCRGRMYSCSRGGSGLVTDTSGEAIHCARWEAPDPAVAAMQEERERPVEPAEDPAAPRFPRSLRQIRFGDPITVQCVCAPCAAVSPTVPEHPTNAAQARDTESAPTSLNVR